jgi:hypothetical protein
MVALSAVIVAVVAYDSFAGTPRTDRLMGLLVGGGMCLAMAVMAFERVRVAIDPVQRTLVWTRTWGFQHRTGSLPFDQVDAVMAERARADEGIPSRRIVVRTKEGRAIPLMMSYRTDSDDAILHAAERIRTLLGTSADHSALASLRALVDAGRVIEAVTVLREAEGLSLTEAKRRVDALRSKR